MLDPPYLGEKAELSSWKTGRGHVPGKVAEAHF
jgi:hypothetical protein